MPCDFKHIVALFIVKKTKNFDVETCVVFIIEIFYIRYIIILRDLFKLQHCYQTTAFGPKEEFIVLPLKAKKQKQKNDFVLKKKKI